MTLQNLQKTQSLLFLVFPGNKLDDYFPKINLFSLFDTMYTRPSDDLTNYYTWQMLSVFITCLMPGNLEMVQKCDL